VSPAYEHESAVTQQLASDCLWSDPATEEMEEGDLDELGFGESLRGGGAVCFGHRAVDRFLATNKFSHVVRAHEAHSEGVGLCKGARVFTVFSTSKDHGQGSGAVAGCILVDSDAIRVINRSTKYKVRGRAWMCLRSPAVGHATKDVGRLMCAPNIPVISMCLAEQIRPPPHQRSSGGRDAGPHREGH
jgi:hypothetical protein